MGQNRASERTGVEDLRKLPFCVRLEMGWGWTDRRGER